MMRQRADYYSVTYPLDSSGCEVPSVPTTPTIAGIACYWQDAGSSVTEAYKQRDEKAKASMFTCNKYAYGLIAVKDQIVFRGLAYRVIGKSDLSTRDVVYRIDLAEMDN